MADKESDSVDKVETSSERIMEPPMKDTDDRAHVEEMAGKEVNDYYESPEFKARERRVVRKLDFYIAPLMGSLNFVSYIDRSNIGFAATQGMADDLNLAASDLNVAISTFYVLYVLSELPISMYAKQWRFERVLPSLTIAFGLITLGGGFVNNNAGLVGTRIILGLFQGCLFPALALFVCNW
jgi:sugar phosphate permease